MIAGLAGDADAYRRLLKALTGHLRAYYLKRLGPGAAEDLVQETLIAMHSKRATYDPAYPLTGWVFGIARYKLIDEFRRSRRHAAVPLEAASELFAEDEIEPAVASRDVNKLLERLPPDKRRMVQDIKLDGLAVAEVAARTGMSESAVKVAVHRALKSVEEGLREDRPQGARHED